MLFVGDDVIGFEKKKIRTEMFPVLVIVYDVIVNVIISCK